jgi:hypothetical protein
MTGSYDIAEFCTFYFDLVFCLLTGYMRSEFTPEALAFLSEAGSGFSLQPTPHQYELYEIFKLS